MSGQGGVSISRSRNGHRFYDPPAVRRQQQQQQQQQLQQQQQQMMQRQQVQKPSKHKAAAEPESRAEPDDCSSTCSVSHQGFSDSANLDRFLEYTTPVVPAQHFSKTSTRERRNNQTENHPYFILGDLWESFKEWSAYGAGVPLLLNGSESVVQYYVPYLSGIQLYIDPSKPSPRLRRPGEESDTESSRETSSDGSADYGVERGTNSVSQGPWNQQKLADVNTQNMSRLSLRNKPFMGSPSGEGEGEGEVSNPPGLLVFQYMEQDSPYGREPLADKISVLASKFPELKTYRSDDLLPSSWVSVAWYPIYRIPMGQTLQNLDACFLTFHSLSTPFQSTNTDWADFQGSSVQEVHSAGMPFKLSLPIFGLAFYKFKLSFWNHNGTYECQRANSLLKAADNRLRLLQVNHPDYQFFVSHNSYWR